MQPPLKSMFVTDPFGTVRSGSGLPDKNGVKRHIGVDLRASIGTSVYAPTSGVVTLRDDVGLKLIEIKASDGKLHRFLHLNKNVLSVGAKVIQGQLIGYSGDTGGVAAHLHWDVRKAGTAWNASYYNYYDPMILLKQGQDMGNLSGHFAGRIVKGMWGHNITAAELAKYTKVDETAMMKRIIDDPQTDKEYARIKKLEEENAMLKAELKPLAPGKYLVN